MVKGYWTIDGAKPLQLVDETLCSLPMDDVNCCYLDHLTLGALTTQCEPAKGQFGEGGPIAFPMIKSAKDEEEEEEKEEESLCSWNCLPSPRGVFLIYTRTSP